MEEWPDNIKGYKKGGLIYIGSNVSKENMYPYKTNYNIISFRKKTFINTSF